MKETEVMFWIVTEWKSEELRWWRANPGPNYCCENRDTWYLRAISRDKILCTGLWTICDTDGLSGFLHCWIWSLKVKNECSVLLRNCHEDVMAVNGRRHVHMVALSRKLESPAPVLFPLKPRSGQFWHPLSVSRVIQNIPIGAHAAAQHDCSPSAP